MLRTGEQYRDSIRDDRQVWMNGERIKDVTSHPAFKPIVDVRARVYDMAHEARYAEIMAYTDGETGETNCIGYKLPHTQDDWHAKRAAVDAVMDDIGGVVIRMGDETAGRDVVALRRPRRARRGRPPVPDEHRNPHRPRADQRLLPRLGQYRPQGRPLEAAPGPGPGHAAAHGQGDRRRHHRARRQVRDRGGLCQPGLRQADHRQLGRRRTTRTTRSASSAR